MDGESEFQKPNPSRGDTRARVRHRYIQVFVGFERTRFGVNSQ